MQLAEAIHLLRTEVASEGLVGEAVDAVLAALSEASRRLDRYESALSLARELASKALAQGDELPGTDAVQAGTGQPRSLGLRAVGGGRP